MLLPFVIPTVFSVVVSLSWCALAYVNSVYEDIPPFGTKTAYNFSLSAAHVDIINMADSRYVPEFCTPIHLNIIFRHGTRDPSLKHTRNFYKLQKKISGKVTTPRFMDLNSWSPMFNITEHDDRSLSLTGEIENMQFGARFIKKYSHIFNSTKDGDVNYYSSRKDRSLNSAEFFQKRFDLDTRPIHIRDDLMRFFDNCKKYVNDVEDNPVSSIEMKKFASSKHVQQVMEEVSNVLGLSGSARLDTYAEVEAAYLALAYELGFKGSSRWEGVFTRRQLDVLEYASDLKQYWKKGYAYPINYEQACPLMKDTFEAIDRVIEALEQGHRYTRGQFQFGHAETVLPLLCLLGLYRDPEHLTAHNFEQNINRQFKTSIISPFAANVGFVLYECDMNKSVSQSDLDNKPDYIMWPERFERYMLQLLVKEIPEAFPFSRYHVMPLDVVRQQYADYIRCPYDTYCQMNSGKTEL